VFLWVKAAFPLISYHFTHILLLIDPNRLVFFKNAKYNKNNHISHAIKHSAYELLY